MVATKTKHAIVEADRFQHPREHGVDVLTVQLVVAILVLAKQLFDVERHLTLQAAGASLWKAPPL